MSLSEIELPCCSICFQNFDSEKLLPIVFSCGHSICKACHENPENRMEKCPTCREPITSRGKNFGLIETLETISQQLEEPYNPRNNFQCSECQKWMIDKNMNICLTCITIKQMMELGKNASYQLIGALSICSNCIVPSHSYKGHTIVPMFPTWSHHNFSFQSSAMKSKLLTWYDKCALLDKTFSELKALSVQVREAYIMYTEMIGRSKETIQNTIIQHMDCLIDPATSLHVQAEYVVTQRTRLPKKKRGTSKMTKMEKFDDAYKSLEKAFKRLKSRRTEVNEKYYTLTDMAEKSTSAELQNECFELIDKLINEKTLINSKIQFALDQVKRKFESNLLIEKIFGAVFNLYL